MIEERHLIVFEDHRSKLMGLAYRFLGTVSDAEDVIQDVYIKWSQADHTTIENPEAWLTKVCTRRCLDTVKSVEKRRVDYVGAWLPEPIQTDSRASSDPVGQMELAESLTTAFLLALERLTPKERAAFLLRTVFDSSYEELAEILNVEQSACRKLVSRAKNNIVIDRVRTTVPVKRASTFLESFQHAIVNGDLSRLKSMLADDVVIRADGGGKVPAILRDIVGREAATHFLVKGIRRFWRDCTWTPARINDNPGLIIQEGKSLHAVVSFDVVENAVIEGIYIVRNPEKIKFINARTVN